MRRAGPLILVAVLAAYLPTLFSDFVFDDQRFIIGNRAVKVLTPRQVVRFFTDPTTVDERAWRGIYRPIRTLEFAVDWALVGPRPFFFHLRNVLYHAIGSLLVLALFRRLLGSEDRTADLAAFCGALAFAIHPVQTEAVAWISSRADVLCLLLFVLGLVLHLDGRRVWAIVVLVLALFTKESAVTFAGAAFLVDRLRGDRPRWRWYAAYAALAAAFAGIWILLAGGGDPARMAQSGHWWGGSYGANLVTTARAFVHYVKLLFLPVDQLVDYHVPARRSLDAGGIVSIVLVVGLVAAALAGGRRSRFAAFWFAVAILPVSNLVVRLAIPSAERFLLLPSVGFCLWAGCVLARFRLRWVVFACLFVLSVSRVSVWSNDDVLWDQTLKDGHTPRSTTHGTFRALERLEASGDPRDVDEVVRYADAYFMLYRDDIHLSRDTRPGAILVPLVGGSLILVNKAEALIFVGRHEEAYRAARKAARLCDPAGETLRDVDELERGVHRDVAAKAHYTASVALEKMGLLEEAAGAAQLAVAMGYDAPGVPSRLASLVFQLAERAEREGRLTDARILYQDSWEAHPHPVENARAKDALDRLRR
ncbi:MAG: hypothetical protein ACYS99_02430 [Planctomycetota bacterium]